MMIPEVDKSDLSTYFLSYGDVDSVKKEVKYSNRWLYENEVYGIPITVVGRGVLYNKKVFKEAGITATGDAKYRNQEFVHTKDPFSDPGDGTGAYNVYKILYDAVADGLTEDDYSTTDWESSKGMLNNGQIATMVLGSWAYPQMQGAGDNADDIGYFAFPITVDGKQYSPADEDYCFGINANSDETNQKAAMIFVKWMTEKSGYSYNEGGLPIAVGDDKLPEVYQEFTDNNVEFISNEPAIEGEEDVLNELNADSELMVGAGGNEKIQAIVEHASNGDEDFDDIMKEWNEKWSDAQDTDDVEVNE